MIFIKIESEGVFKFHVREILHLLLTNFGEFPPLLARSEVKIYDDDDDVLLIQITKEGLKISPLGKKFNSYYIF
jgi:hypothetical protein